MEKRLQIEEAGRGVRLLPWSEAQAEFSFHNYEIEILDAGHRVWRDNDAYLFAAGGPA